MYNGLSYGGDPPLSSIDKDLWETAKPMILENFPIWDLIMFKVCTEQPEDSLKRLFRMFEEVEGVLSRFQSVVRECCHVGSDGDAKSNRKCIFAGTCVGQFMGFEPNKTQIYLRDGLEDVSAAEMLEVKMENDDPDWDDSHDYQSTQGLFQLTQSFQVDYFSK